LDFSSDLLVESKAVREEGISRLKAQKSEEQVLNKVKQLFFAVWKDKSRTTRQQLAEFYEVPVATIDSNYKRHTEEFESDGVEVLRAFDLKDARGIMPLASTTSQETIYTSAGALRMGFILRDSEVAKTVRTIAIRFIQGAGQLPSSQVVLQSLTTSNPVLAPFVKEQSLKVSSPLSNFSEKERSVFIKKYPQGYPYVLPKMPDADSKKSGVTTDELRERFQFLSTYVDDFTLKGDKELEIQLGEPNRKKVPHMISNIFEFDGVNGTERAVMMFQYHNVAIEFEWVENCLGRNYIQIAKNYLGVDHAYLIFISPLGVTPDAATYIKNSLSSGFKGYVGALTVREFANFLQELALSTRNYGVNMGKIKGRFEQLLKDPFQLEQIPLFDLPQIDAPPENKLIT